MGKIKLPVILIVCFVLPGLITSRASAETIGLTITGEVYHMISSPYMPDDRDPQVSLADDLGPYDKIQWRFFRYGYYENPNNPGEYINKYFELKTDWIDEHDFDFGKGYWVISRSARTIVIEGEPVAENRIKLEHEGEGWNQIGNIYDSDFLVEYLYVARESSPGDLKQLIDVTNNDLTNVTLQEFENGSYIDIPAAGKDSLEVGKAYWLKVRGDVGEDVYLIFDPAGLTSVSTANFTGQDFIARVAEQEDPPDPPPGFTSSFNSDSDGATVGCFIATAAYSDYDHPDVQLLRKFRDRYLLTSSFGRILVDMYYRYSPTLARYMAKHTPIKVLVRFNFIPVIGISTIVSGMNVYGFLIVIAFPFLGSFFLLRKRKGAWGKCKQKFPSKSKEGKRKK